MAGRVTSELTREQLRRAKALLDLLAQDNRLIVSHEEGQHETVVNVEINPAGELVVWVE